MTNKTWVTCTQPSEHEIQKARIKKLESQVKDLEHKLAVTADAMKGVYDDCMELSKLSPTLGGRVINVSPNVGHWRQFYEVMTIIGHDVEGME